MPIGMQTFGNPVAPTADDDDDNDNENKPPDLTALGRAMVELPHSASTVSATDGYKPEAMLFVDEEFATTSRASREGNLSALMWKPVCKFSSNHYRYVTGPDGPHIVQVGIGADDPTGTGLGFAEPAAGAVAPSPAVAGWR